MTVNEAYSITTYSRTYALGCLSFYCFVCFGLFDPGVFFVKIDIEDDIVEAILKSRLNKKNFKMVLLSFESGTILLDRSIRKKN